MSTAFKTTTTVSKGNKVNILVLIVEGKSVVIGDAEARDDFERDFVTVHATTLALFEDLNLHPTESTASHNAVSFSTNVSANDVIGYLKANRHIRGVLVFDPYSIQDKKTEFETSAGLPATFDVPAKEDFFPEYPTFDAIAAAIDEGHCAKMPVNAYKEGDWPPHVAVLYEGGIAIALHKETIVLELNVGKYDPKTKKTVFMTTKGRVEVEVDDRVVGTEIEAKPSVKLQPKLRDQVSRPSKSTTPTENVSPDKKELPSIDKKRFSLRTSTLPIKPPPKSEEEKPVSIEDKVQTLLKQDLATPITQTMIEESKQMEEAILSRDIEVQAASLGTPNPSTGMFDGPSPNSGTLASLLANRPPRIEHPEDVEQTSISHPTARLSRTTKNLASSSPSTREGSFGRSLLNRAPLPDKVETTDLTTHSSTPLRSVLSSTREGSDLPVKSTLSELSASLPERTPMSSLLHGFYNPRSEINFVIENDNVSKIATLIREKFPKLKSCSDEALNELKVTVGPSLKEDMAMMRLVKDAPDPDLMVATYAERRSIITYFLNGELTEYESMIGNNPLKRQTFEWLMLNPSFNDICIALLNDDASLSEKKEEERISTDTIVPPSEIVTHQDTLTDMIRKYRRHLMAAKFAMDDDHFPPTYEKSATHDEWIYWCIIQQIPIGPFFTMTEKARTMYMLTHALSGTKNSAEFFSMLMHHTDDLFTTSSPAE